ncbi:hypothetical protein GGR57DRAFT_251759 [Xylariaceae sp. FL1272]|nr:hypothetical protein GGR57DRAFT_251759 [Xylariaceae sp. FL1272]
MKQRFSSLDVKVIAHELSASLVSLRVSQIYDLSSKILLFKFAKPENKKQLLIDSGFRCHLTEFARTTAASPSIFVQKLRKVLKTRRCTSVSQIGTDRIIEFQFSDGLYRLYLEFFAGGNVILTDADLKILTLMRFVPEGEGQEPQRPGLQYSLDNRQNYGGIPDLTKERLQGALKTIIEKSSVAAAGGKKIKKKPGDELRKGLAITINELPPILLDHAMKTADFDSTLLPATILENQDLLDHLLRSLVQARTLVEEILRSDTCKGYIFAKARPGADKASTEAEDDGQQRKKSLLYEDFHPFLPRQFEEDPQYTVVTFDSFGQTVDDFFSSIEGQKLESRLTEREAAAKRKLDAARSDQQKRIDGLKEVQTLNERRAGAIEANIERVQEALDAVNGLIQQGMDWENIGKLIERERHRNNPVAAIIQLPLKLHENTITVLLGELEDDEDEEDEADETDSSDNDSDFGDSGFGGSVSSKQKGRERRLAIDLDLALSPYSNAREYYGERKTAAAKEEKTKLQSEIALKNAEQKITAELKKGLKQEKPVLQPIRRQMWFEKFLWFLSTDGYLVLGGKDTQQNEQLYRRYLKKGDVYLHADLHGAPSVIIKNSPSTPDAPIPPSTLAQAGSLAVCGSSAWDQKASMSAWWVTADQVSKSAPAGEFLPTGSFMVRGKKNFLPASQLIMGFALMFKVSEESKAKHLKHRLYDTPVKSETPSEQVPEASGGAGAHTESATGQPGEQGADEDSYDSGFEEDEDTKPRSNPLQDFGGNDRGIPGLDTIDEQSPSEEMRNLVISEEASPESLDAEEARDENDEAEEENGDANAATETDSMQTTDISQAPTPGEKTNQPKLKEQQPKRGQRGKAKKMAQKYKHQDEEDRAGIEALIGASAGKQRAEAEAKAKAEREAALQAQRERRRAQHQRQQKETAEHEEVRKLMLDEGIETLDPDEVQNLSPLDSLVGTPLPGDEILEVVVLCAPYAAVGKCKYKVKLQPGAQKKGKAVKEILESWKAISSKKGVLDEKSQDKERMWPREVELLKGIKAEDVINSVPMKSLKVMTSGGSSGSGGGGGGQGKGKGRGGKKK